MEAQNKSIGAWISDIERGVLRLPRFQRKVVWKPDTTKRFLEAVLNGHPLGILLVLEVDSNNQPFFTRPVSGLPEGGEGCRQHLLDGQQRLTALVKSLKDNYEDDSSYYVRFKRRDDGGYTPTGVERSKRTKPLHKDPAKEHDRGWLPMRLLEPGSAGHSRAYEWKRAVESAKGWEGDENRRLDEFVAELQQLFSATPIPCLAIPQGTEQGEAIDIFQNFNTSAVRLSAFDIANALCEKQVSDSLQEYVEQVARERPLLVRLEGEKSLGDLILKLACIDQDLKPREGSYRSIRFKEFMARRDFFSKGFEWTEGFVVAEGVCDPRWLPSTVPFRVLPLLHGLFLACRQGDREKADRLVRGYLWRAYLTARYSRQANDRLHADHGALRKMLEDRSFEPDEGADTIFDEREYPLPDGDEIGEEGWPKSKGTLKRAILAVCVKRGAKGIETGESLSRDTSRQRDYHHVYPKTLLGPDGDAMLAVNCMMLEPEANRSWNSDWPGDYLARKIDRGGGGPEARTKLIRRLETHTLPAEHLLAAKGGGTHGSPLESYRQFRDKRIALILKGMRLLCDGEEYR